jgi:hypothetical protein
VWTATPLTSGLFVLAAFFVAAAIAATARIKVALLLAALLATLPGLFILSRIAARRFVRTASALVSGAYILATLSHTLISISVVCHTVPPFLFDDENRPRQIGGHVLFSSTTVPKKKVRKLRDREVL